MGEEGGLLAASETSYHKWRRGRWSTGGLCVGTGRGIECLWPCPRDADTADDEPGQSGQTQTQRIVLACMGGPPWRTVHRLYVDRSAEGARRRDRGPRLRGPGPGRRGGGSVIATDYCIINGQRMNETSNFNLLRAHVTAYRRSSKSHLTVDVRYFARTAASTVYAFRRLAGPLPPPPGLPRRRVPGALEITFEIRVVAVLE